jgi:Na+-translocating ferredoxin:NAD+ oxidoreductase RnfC subunit
LGHNLHPDKVMRIASYGHTGQPPSQAGQVFLCCECGLCEQACVMGLQPWRLNHELKGQLGPAISKAFVRKAPTEANRFREIRRYPIPKLVERLTLGKFEKIKAPLLDYPGTAARVKLLLKQHLGAPGEPTVRVGAEVTCGDVVAAPPSGALGALVHASITGKVTEIDQISITIVA